MYRVNRFIYEVQMFARVRNFMWLEHERTRTSQVFRFETPSPRPYMAWLEKEIKATSISYGIGDNRERACSLLPCIEQNLRQHTETHTM